MRLKNIFFFFFLLILSSCGSCGDNSGTTSATNPTSSTSVRTSAVITMSALNGVKVTVSIPLAAFGNEEGLATAMIDIFVNSILRIDDLVAQDYYNSSTQQVRFTMQPVSDGDELSFTINLSDSNLTYTGQVSATEETQATIGMLEEFDDPKTLFLYETSEGTYDLVLDMEIFGNQQANLNGASLLISIENEPLNRNLDDVYALSSFYDSNEGVLLPGLEFENFDDISLTLTLSDGEVRGFFIDFEEDLNPGLLTLEYAAFFTTSTSSEAQSFTLDEASASYSSECDAAFILDSDFMIDATLSVPEVEAIIADGQVLSSPSQINFSIGSGMMTTSWNDFLERDIIANISDNGDFFGYKRWLLPSQLDYSYQFSGTIVEDQITIQYLQQLSSSLAPYAGESCEVEVTWTGTAD